MVRTLAATVAFAALFTALPAHSQAPEWFGVWRLSLEKSVYDPGPPPYRRATMRVEPRAGGTVRFSYDFVFPRGGVQHLEWTGRFDGTDYIVQGADEYITYAYRQTAERTYEISASATQRVLISAGSEGDRSAANR